MCIKNELHLEILEKSAIECADVDKLLGDLVDGDLIPTLEGRIREHISACTKCSESERGYRWVVESAKELKVKPLPEQVSQRLRVALNKRLGLSLAVDAE